MKFNSLEEINSFINKFMDCSLPKIEWTHKAHFVVGLYYLFHYKEGALDKIRVDIKKYNLSKGVENNESGGYHESVTRFYLWAINKFILKDLKEIDLSTYNNMLCHEVSVKEFPYKYYSKDLLLSSKARLNWVEPDLMILD